MFYQTKLSKIYDGGAVDSHNKFLKFIGRLPVQAGDYVWTDGNFIFGHVPFREEPNLTNVQGGIPAAFSAAKGYFSKFGSFRPYPIAVDKTSPRWIVNGKKKYFHSTTRVFDAEIAIDENGVEDGLFTAELDGINGGNGGIYFIQDDIVLDDDAVVIKKDGKEISRVYLHDYIHAINKAKEMAARGAIAPASKKFIGHSQLLNFQLHTDGSWDAIIASFAYAELRWEYKSYPPNDGQSHHVDEDFRRAWKVVDVEPQNVYYGKAYVERNYLVLFDSDDTFDDMVQKMRDKFADCGFDVQGDLYNAVAKTARGVGDVATIWHYGEEFVDIEPPSGTAGTERIICTYYLVHANSKGVTKILHEYANATALQIYADERYVFDEISAPANDIDFFWSVWNNDTDLPITHILGHVLGVIDPFAVSAEIFETHVTYWHVYIKRPLQYSDDAISMQHYQPTWLYPLQDEYWCQMSEWKILAILDKNHNPIVRTFKDSGEPFSFPFENERWLYRVSAIGQIFFQRFCNDSLTPISDLLILKRTHNFMLGAFGRYWAPTYLPRGKNFQYLTKRYSASEGSRDTAWLSLPAVVKLKNGGYLIGLPENEVYKVDKDGVAELISDKNQLANLRLRYMPNLSKTRL